MVFKNMETMQIFNATGIFGVRPVAWLLTISMLFDATKACGPQAGLMGPQGPGGQANPNGTFPFPGINATKAQNSTGPAPPPTAGTQSTQPKAAGVITPVPALVLPVSLPTPKGPLNTTLPPGIIGLNATSLPAQNATTKIPAVILPALNVTIPKPQPAQPGNTSDGGISLPEEEGGLSLEDKLNAHADENGQLPDGTPKPVTGTIPAANQTIPKAPAQGGPPFNKTERDFVDSESEQEPTIDSIVDQQPKDDIEKSPDELPDDLNSGANVSAAIVPEGNSSSQPTNESSAPVPPGSDPGLVGIPVIVPSNVSNVSLNNSIKGTVGLTTAAGPETMPPGGVPGVVGIPVIPQTSVTLTNTTNNSTSDKSMGNSELGSTGSHSNGNETASDNLIAGNSEPVGSGSQSKSNETASDDLIGGNSELGSSDNQSRGNQTASDDLIGGNSDPVGSGSQSNGNQTASDDLIGGSPDNYNAYDGLMDDGSNAQNGTASPDFESPSYGNEPGVPGGAAIGGNGTVSVNSTQIGPQDFPLGHEDSF